jgi:hypothetical protein
MYSCEQAGVAKVLQWGRTRIEMGFVYLEAHLKPEVS